MDIRKINHAIGEGLLAKHMGKTKIIAETGAGQHGVSIATVFFALSTILGWAYYGEVSVGYIFSKRRKTAIMIYRIIYVVFVFVGAIAEINTVWLIADCFNVLMAIPNLIALIALSKIIKDLTKAHFEKKKGLPELNENLK